ncbi:hypothetical protein JHK82_047052 [Glycine max]|uniref:DDT domain-containing protein DDR4 isoform A n=1 Tax=Glycine soja TaxID=3848 RepID=A0A445G4I0_GLYSO|nr:DDT domain-containing protein DDR4-like [Glycine soja]XP_040867064.1 DDT domain-containing protein DDR4-like [Glycine max]KAG4378751.1 hypothetical protein GLYMA_17G095633v4 [Glycine max]KAG4929983.1 hypothetical protein JHK86_046944 [Glycine max]KAG5097198.1 hypothetical protein JHK82_047052 [Glycine max]KAG5101986.1 hypothetical protein JHK84_046955 [Glycine max]KAH1117665.1 hypothetical protein GYH30_046777 [Glycine max]
MPYGSPPSVPGERSSPEPNPPNHVSDLKEETTAAAPPPLTTRSTRPSRACTMRASSRLLSSPAPSKKVARARKEGSPRPPSQCSKIVTPLVEPPSPSQLPRWNLRSMWEFASVLNFLHLFRPLLNISLEFSAEEFETALLAPNDTLFHIHMPLLKAIPPITRMALTRDTWITVLCRKLRDWWHWVADGDLPIVASHGAEIEIYKLLDPGVRVVILKVLCDIRVEQEDIRSYIDNSMKHGVQLSTFRKERIGGDSNGISYWYEDDPIIGHRMYREIRKTEVVQMKKGKPRGSLVLSNTSYLWEVIATNFDEFEDVSEKLFSSKNRTETSVGKRLKIDMLPEIEKVHKKKEKLLKKQHRQALLLDNYLVVDGLGPGRSLRDRKPVTYTFDDYDQSIKEAIKVTKQKQSSPEHMPRRESVAKAEALTNGKYGPPYATLDRNFGISSPESSDSDDDKEDNETDNLDRSNRQRRRPKRYTEREFVEAVSDNETDFDSDDDIVGEAVYDEEYLKKRKQKRMSSSGSEGDDEEYQWDEYNVEDDEEEDDDDDDSLSISEDSDKPLKVKQLRGRTRRETKLRSVGEIQSGLRRSKRATKNRINYRQCEASESETELIKSEKSNSSADHSDPSENGEYMMESEDSDGSDNEEQEKKVDEPVPYPAVEENEQNQPPEKLSSPGQEEVESSTGKRRFLDLNELAPSTGFDDGPNTIMKDEDNDY